MSWYSDYVNISALEGKTLSNITASKDKDEILFTTTGGESYRMYHEQDCCESVSIEDICGDLNDLLNTPIIQAFQKSEEGNKKEWDDSSTWTFYTLATIKGTVTIRWYGTSNGYYSESVSIVKV